VNSRVQIVAVIGSVAFLVLVLELVRRRRLAEEYSALWIVGALALLLASLRPDIIDRTAVWLGIYYGPAVLLLGLVVVVSAVLLWMTVVLSQQQAQIDHLIEETAILGAELREERGGQVRGPSRRLVRSAALRSGQQSSP
jgi:hypothetical protein